MPASTVDVGSTLDDTYTIEALIGRGGMGSVFRARHARLPGKHVAVKVLNADVADPDMIVRFRHEAEIASRLGHANIAEIYDFNTLPDGTPYLVLEYLRGETLSARLHRGAVTLDATLAIVRQIGSALAAAHAQGVIHRDLKPGNVFLASTEVDGKAAEVAKLLDFGVSKLRGSLTVKTSPTMMIGTPQYMAPEQARGQHDAVDERADVFSLGVIVYEMLGGRPAFDGGSVHEVVYRVVHEQPRPLAELAPDVPAQVRDAIARAMAKPVEDRFRTIGDFVAALTGEPLASVAASAASAARTVMAPRDALLQSMPPTLDERVRKRAPVTPAPATSPMTPPASRRGGAAIALAIAAIAAVAAIGGGIIYVATRTPAPAPPPAARAIAIDASVLAIDPSSPAVAATRDDAAVAVAVAEPDARAAIATAVDAAAIVPASPADAAVADDDTTEQQLDAAEHALDAGELRTAERLAIATLHDPDATTAQRAHARTLHAMLACRVHNDIEGAQADLRTISAPAQRRRVIVACHDAGIDLAP